MATGDLKRLGTFYLGGTRVIRPTYPWRIDDTPPGASNVGNIARFTPGQSIEIRDTDALDSYKIQWIEIEENDKKYLVADRNLLVYVSWNDLNSQGLINGKEITIDGQKYLLRVLTIGNDYRIEAQHYSGGTLPNEWDRWIVNEGGFSGLPTPNASDLDQSQTTVDFQSTHNRKWNWFYASSWGKDTWVQNSAVSANRGHFSARYFLASSKTNRGPDYGWRPVLEVLNAAPTITPMTTPSGSYTAKPSFNYTVSDADNHTMTITESIDGIIFNTRTAVASGTQLTFTPTDIAWLRTRINQTVNITITADDGNGGVTTVNYPITRTTPAIDLALKTPFETDVAARRLLLQLEGNIPADAVVSVQACNNAFDASPTWENATNLVLSGFPYPFNNTTKTAAKWGVSFKVRVERGGSTQPIYIDGLGGAFD